MPIFDYVCPKCGEKFEELVRTHDESGHCPKCGAEATRQWSGCMYTSTGKPPKHCSGNCRDCRGCH